MDHFYQNVKGFTKGSNLKLFDFILEKTYNNFNWVELGTFTGKSAAYCVVELINQNIDFNFTCVDLWQPVEKFNNFNYTYEAYLETMKPVEKYIKNIRDYSHLSAKKFADNSVDFCYVDADHSYEGVRKDLHAWWPKIKSGAYFGGDDYTKGWPGVCKAVNEFFAERNIAVTKIGRCWCVKKP